LEVSGQPGEAHNAAALMVLLFLALLSGINAEVLG
jgi:hypothetical protein